MQPLSCVCGTSIERITDNLDVKCPGCGRVYNGRGQYLWREPLDGSFHIGETAVGEKRAPDQEAAIEQAFADGKLPEEDRRDAPAKPAAKSRKSK